MIIPDFCLTEFQKNSMINSGVIIHEQRSDFTSYPITYYHIDESKYKDEVFLTEDKNTEHTTAYASKSAGAILQLMRSAKTVADVAGLLAAINSLFLINPVFANNLIGLVRTKANTAK